MNAYVTPERIAPPTVSPAVAIMAFLAWLTTRNTPVTFGGTHDAAIAVELWESFVTVNDWSTEFPPEWPNVFVMPEEDNPQNLNVFYGEAPPSNPNQTDLVTLHFPDN